VGKIPKELERAVAEKKEKGAGGGFNLSGVPSYFSVGEIASSRERGAGEEGRKSTTGTNLR